MRKYRWEPKKGHAPSYDKILVQKKKWWGWKTIASFYIDTGGINRAKTYIKELESWSNKKK